MRRKQLDRSDLYKKQLKKSVSAHTQYICDASKYIYNEVHNGALLYMVYYEGWIYRKKTSISSKSMYDIIYQLLIKIYMLDVRNIGLYYTMGI